VSYAVSRMTRHGHSREYETAAGEESVRHGGRP
jgi:hypothetical protein